MTDDGNSTPPGWYPDGAGSQRWWDGQQWTEHTAEETSQAAQQMYCTNCAATMWSNAAACSSCGYARGTIVNYCASCGTAASPGQAMCLGCGAGLSVIGSPSKDKMVAGLLAIFLGGFGVHKFYPGYSTAGIIQIVISVVTCGLAGIIPFIEGIIYLTKTDEVFNYTYVVNKKEWF